MYLSIGETFKENIKLSEKNDVDIELLYRGKIGDTAVLDGFVRLYEGYIDPRTDQKTYTTRRLVEGTVYLNMGYTSSIKDIISIRATPQRYNKIDLVAHNHKDK